MYNSVVLPIVLHGMKFGHTHGLNVVEIRVLSRLFGLKWEVDLFYEVLRNMFSSPNMTG
jgi:hypothetical protein